MFPVSWLSCFVCDRIFFPHLPAISHEETAALTLFRQEVQSDAHTITLYSYSWVIWLSEPICVGGTCAFSFQMLFLHSFHSSAIESFFSLMLLIFINIFACFDDAFECIRFSISPFLVFLCYHSGFEANLNLCMH